MSAQPKRPKWQRGRILNKPADAPEAHGTFIWLKCKRPKLGPTFNIRREHCGERPVYRTNIVSAVHGRMIWPAVDVELIPEFAATAPSVDYDDWLAAIRAERAAAQ